MEVVARFLALLELYRQQRVTFTQLTPLGELHVRWTGPADAEPADDEPDTVPGDGAPDGGAPDDGVPDDGVPDDVATEDLP